MANQLHPGQLFVPERGKIASLGGIRTHDTLLYSREGKEPCDIIVEGKCVQRVSYLRNESRWVGEETRAAR